MKCFSAVLATGVVMIAAAGPACAARSDLDGIWSPADRNIPRPGGGAQGGGAPDGRGGFQRQNAIPPYKPDWAARYQEIVASSRAGKIMVDPTARCLPPGMPRTMSTPFPIEFSVEPNRVLVLFEIGGVRRIPTNGATHPATDDLDPTFMGDSVGHWEGDALVVDTLGLRGDTVFDASGTIHSDKMHIIERIRLIGPDKLEDRMTIEDPVAFTRPWEVVHTYDRKPDWHIMEFVCEENNRGVDPNAPGGN